MCRLENNILVNNCYVEKISEHNEKYAQYVSNLTPKSKMFPSVIWAFVIGGLICIIGEGLYMAYRALFSEYTPENIGAMVAVTLVAVAAILTAFGIYDKIGSFAGGGSIVPITGFSNAMSSAAIEHRKEGIIFGAATNMFKVAGPVIVVGLVASMLVGLIYYVVGLFGG